MISDRPKRVDDVGDAGLQRPTGGHPTAGRGSPGAAAGQRSVDDRFLEHDRACLPGADRIGDHVEAGDQCGPRGGATVVVSMPIVVDLPAPFGPSNPNTSPGRPRSRCPRRPQPRRGRSCEDPPLRLPAPCPAPCRSFRCSCRLLLFVRDRRGAESLLGRDSAAERDAVGVSHSGGLSRPTNETIVEEASNG